MSYPKPLVIFLSIIAGAMAALAAPPPLDCSKKSLAHAVLDAKSGDLVRRVYFSSRSHDTQYPLVGPVFQTTKADDGSGNYLYMVNPQTYAVSRVGPYLGILGPFAVDGSSSYVVNNVTRLWGMQVADLKTGQIITAEIPEHPPESAALMHGIGWTPDQKEVWQSGQGGDPHVYVWNLQNPMAPVLQTRLTLRSGQGSHWLTFDIKGDYAYVAPWKNSDDGTEIFDVATHRSVGVIGASEDMLEVDIANGRVTQMAGSVRHWTALSLDNEATSSSLTVAWSLSRPQTRGTLQSSTSCSSEPGVPISRHPIVKTV